MPVPPSVNGTYLFGKETSYGTGGTANKDIGLVQNFETAPDANIEEQFGQGQSKAVFVKNGIITPKGTIDILLQHGRPIEWAIFGGTTTHADTSTDSTHTFVWANVLPSLIWEAGYENGDTDLVEDGTGFQFGSTTIGATIDGILKMNGDWMAKTLDNSGTPVTAATVNTGAPLGGFECGMSLGGNPINFTQSWELTHNGNTKVLHGQGARGPADGSSHERNISFRGKMGFSSVAEMTQTLGSSSAITTTEPVGVAAVFSADNGINLGSGERSLTLTLSGAQWKYRRTASKNDFVMVDVEGSGILASGNMVDQVLEAAW